MTRATFDTYVVERGWRIGIVICMGRLLELLCAFKLPAMLTRTEFPNVKAIERDTHVVIASMVWSVVLTNSNIGLNGIKMILVILKSLSFLRPRNMVPWNIYLQSLQRKSAMFLKYAKGWSPRILRPAFSSKYTENATSNYLNKLSLIISRCRYNLVYIWECNLCVKASNICR